jgi:small nuclear ribonucleoprotein (snRNP)-like protein
VRHVLRNRLRSHVIITLKAGQSFRGVLYDHDRDALVLRNTEHLEGQGGPTPVDGELLVLIADVAFIQLPS